MIWCHIHQDQTSFRRSKLGQVPWTIDINYMTWHKSSRVNFQIKVQIICRSTIHECLAPICPASPLAWVPIQWVRQPKPGWQCWQENLDQDVQVTSISVFSSAKFLLMFCCNTTRPSRSPNLSAATSTAWAKFWLLPKQENLSHLSNCLTNERRATRSTNIAPPVRLGCWSWLKQIKSRYIDRITQHENKNWVLMWKLVEY